MKEKTRMSRRIVSVLAAFALVVAVAAWVVFTGGSFGGAEPDAQADSRAAGQTAITPRPRTLTVFAAASLIEAFTDLGAQFEAAHEGVNVQFNFAGSQRLRAQLEQGARSDVFASANVREMAAAVAVGIVAADAPVAFARNRLVVIFPADNPGGIRALGDLARPGLKLDVADPSVPVGQYTLSMFDKMGCDPAYGETFRAGALANVVSREENVKAVVTKVALGEADAGVVYVSDVTPQAAPHLGTVEIPDRFNLIATYPVAVVRRPAEPDLGRQFVAFILSEAGQQTLAAHGLIPVDGQ